MFYRCILKTEKKISGRNAVIFRIGFAILATAIKICFKHGTFSILTSLYERLTIIIDLVHQKNLLDVEIPKLWSISCMLVTTKFGPHSSKIK